MHVFQSVVVGQNTYGLEEVAHALLVGSAIFHGRVAPTLAGRIRCSTCVTLGGGGKGRGVSPCFIMLQDLFGRGFDMMVGSLAGSRRICRRTLERLLFSSSLSSVGSCS